jgi:hypothetical protein
MRQTNIYDFLDEKDWIDQTYIVYKTFHKGEWSEYSPKFLTNEEALVWRVTKGEQLCDTFGRKLKKFNAKPSDNQYSFYVAYRVGEDWKTKLVPGEDFYDSCANLELFMNVDDIMGGFKNK